MKPKSRDEFIDYVLRNLGAPVIDINVDADQVDDRVDEALAYYQKYHYDAVERFLMPHQVTQENIDNGFISVSDLIISITSIVHIGGGGSSSISHTNWMSALGQSMYNMKWDLSFGIGQINCGSGSSLTDYELTLQHLRRIDTIFGDNYKQFDFNYRSKKLILFLDWVKTFAVDDFIICDTYQIIDPTTYGDIWNDEWLIEYATALVGRQWGVNLSKFAGVELPGGIQLDGDKIYDRYHERYLELREQMQNKFEEPVNFLIG